MYFYGIREYCAVRGILVTVIGGGGVGVVEVFTQRVLQIKYDLYVSLEL